MSGMVTLFLWFMFYSFVGWVWETSYCSMKAHHFINRGFLNGPIIPIYGFGAVLVMIVMSLLRYSPIPEHLSYVYIPLVFFGGMVVCTLLEYITSVILEAAFHIRWWDYSKQRFNLQGRICLKSSLFFGFGSVVILYVIQPLVSSASSFLPDSAANSLALVLLVLMTVDITVTLSTLLHLRKRLGEIPAQLAVLADEVSEEAEEFRDEVSEFFDGRRRQIARLAKAFPTSVSRRYDAAWERVKELVHERG